MQLPKQGMMTVLFIEILCHAPGLNANGFTWFDAQEKCRTVGSTITTSNPSTSEEYWTRYNYRVSQWIGKYGCYSKSNLVERKNESLYLPSAGLCLEFCLEDHESTEMLFFAVKNKSCICLNNCPDGSSVSRCSFSCLENQVSPKVLPCGGEVEFSVFFSRKDYTSNEILNATKNHSRQFSVNLTRPQYLSFDKGKRLTEKAKKDIVKCQRCTDLGCPYVKCNESTLRIYCSDGTTFPDQHSTQLLPRTNKTTSSEFTTFSISTKKITKGRVRFLTSAKVTTRDSSPIYSVNSASYIYYVSSPIALTKHPMDRGKSDDVTFQVGILASSTAISIICIGIFFYCIRYYFVNQVGRTLPKLDSTILSDAGESNRRSQHIRPSTQNYSSSYNLEGNDKFEHDTLREEEQYHYLGKPAFACIADDDNYMKPGNKALKMYFDGEENYYNCLRENIRLNYDEDDTYSHAQNMDLSNSSNYGVMNVKRKTEEIIGEDLYDHFESNL